MLLLNVLKQNMTTKIFNNTNNFQKFYHFVYSWKNNQTNFELYNLSNTIKTKEK